MGTGWCAWPETAATREPVIEQNFVRLVGSQVGFSFDFSGKIGNQAPARLQPGRSRLPDRTFQYNFAPPERGFFMQLAPVARWLIPITFWLSACAEPEQHASSESRPLLFTDVTAQLGLDFRHDPTAGNYEMPEIMTGGGGFADFDNDGRLDIALIRSFDNNDSTTSLLILRQSGNSDFKEFPIQVRPKQPAFAVGLAIGDFDNDGDQDLYVPSYGRDMLFRNSGKSEFEDISAPAGIDNQSWGESATLLDFDADGLLDVYVANYVQFDPAVTCNYFGGQADYCGPGSFPGVADKLYRNRGNRTFEDVSEASGISRAARKGLGVVSLDFNDDGFPDIYVANDGEPNLLWMNQRDGTFRERAVEYGVAVNNLGQPEAGMGVAAAVLNSGERPSLFVTHLGGETNTLYQATGSGLYVDNTDPAGLAGPSRAETGFGAVFLDYDHDGDQDLALVNGRVVRGEPVDPDHDTTHWDHYAERNQLFENLGNNRFREHAAGTAGFGTAIETSRALAAGDIDNDGDLDLLVTNVGAPTRIFRNDTPKAGNWLQLRVLEHGGTRDAIGAAVTLFCGTEVFTRAVAAGGSYLTSHDPRVHFGIGAHASVDSIRIKWVGGEQEQFAGHAANRHVRLVRGTGNRR